MFISLQMKGNLCNLQQLREINATASSLAPAVSPGASTAPSLPPTCPRPRRPYPRIPTSRDERTVADLHTLSCRASQPS